MRITSSVSIVINKEAGILRRFIIKFRKIKTANPAHIFAESTTISPMIHL
jgi:hypothetical protein